MTPTGLSIILPTLRREPMLGDIVRSIAAGIRLRDGFTRPIQLIIVDGRLWYDDIGQRVARFTALVREALGHLMPPDYSHVPPKPTVWQGPDRLTPVDLWDKPSAVNTGICYARYSHLIFIDDCQTMAPTWLAAHARAADRGFACCGPFDNGPIEDMHRLQRMPKAGFAPKGGWMFGRNCSAPLSRVLEVNGMDEIMSGAAADDGEFGERISRVCQVWWDPEASIHCLPSKDEAEVVPRKTPDELARVRANYRKLEELLDGREHPDRPGHAHLTVGNQFGSLSALRARIQRGEAFPVPTEPTHDWRDGVALKDKRA